MNKITLTADTAVDLNGYRLYVDQCTLAPVDDGLTDERVKKILWNVLQALDSSEAWGRARRDPDALAAAVRAAFAERRP